MKQGSIEVIVGCMSSGKSGELVRRMDIARIAKQRTVMFKPNHDTRSEDVASRDGRRHEAVSVAGAVDILPLVAPEHHVVGLDEAHFFDPFIVETAMALVRQGKRVIIAGLDTDFRGEPFGALPQLLAIADDVTKLKAVCMQCFGPAVRSQLLVAQAASSGDPLAPELVGGDDKYEARCRDCHYPPR